MSYTALYRKFRPERFEDVKGQDHIVTTLRNQIEADRIGHAYLFCGTRGTGKTTIAKIFAKAVNCEHPVDGSPCGECRSCRAIAAAASMNVIEIDAASNNGVDNIREIVDEVSYSPAEGRFKVYIIDEVHMLSIGAFNALLKTLEEPPSYVIFILATTEVHKIPVTILSRCQRYDFKRITIDTITGRLRELMVQEQQQVEEKALRYVAKAADGSMRDALSLLDQCIGRNSPMTWFWMCWARWIPRSSAAFCAPSWTEALLTVSASWKKLSCREGSLPSLCPILHGISGTCFLSKLRMKARLKMSLTYPVIIWYA